MQNTPRTPKIVALYARVSTKDRQEAENQLRGLREYCRKQDWQIANEYVDHDSGSKSEREQFKQLFTHAHQKRFDTVVFWALDRFSREGTRETLNYLHQLESVGVAFVSYTEPYVNSSLYELAILGAATPKERTALTATISDMVGEFGLELDAEVIIYDGTSIADRNKHAAFAAVYFGGSEQRDLEAVRELILSSAPVIPSVGPNVDFDTGIPNFLQSANGLSCRKEDPAMSELAAAMLECVGLLRAQRRVFVSYRRTESRATAVQLHDLLSARGFDVFLDTHDIRPGDSFQDGLAGAFAQKPTVSLFAKR